MQRREIGDFIRAKYVEGRWLAEEDRKAFGLEKLEGQGKAL